MRNKVLIIAPWGKPHWEEVTYLVEDTGDRLISKTTILPLVYHAIRNGYEVTRICVVVPESLIVDRVTNAGDLVKLSYNEIRDRVRNYICEKMWEFNEIFRNKNPGVDISKVLRKALNVVVTPGIGRFTLKKKDINIVFDGDLELVRLYVYLHTLKICIENPDIDEVWLDLTHGINYMPVIISMAARDLYESIVLMKLNRRNTILRIFNSDPHTYGIKMLRINRIVTIESSRFENISEMIPKEIPDKVISKPESCIRGLSNDEKRFYRNILTLDKVGEGYTNYVRIVYYSLKHSLPLGLLDMIPRYFKKLDPSKANLRYITNMISTIDKMLDKAKPIKIDDDTLLLKTRDVFEKGVALKYIDILKTLSVGLGIKCFLNEKGYIERDVESEGVSFSDIEVITDEVLSKFSNVVSSFVQRELYGEIGRVVYENYKSVVLSNMDRWRILNDMIKKDRWKKDISMDKTIEKIKESIRLRYVDSFKPRDFVSLVEDSRSRDHTKRNFIAHIGLLREYIEIMVENWREMVDTRED